MEITGHQLLIFQEAAPSSAIKSLMSDCTHKPDQAQRAAGFGVWLKAQPPWFGVTQSRAAEERERPAQDLQLLSQRVWGVCMKQRTPKGCGGCIWDRLGGSACSQASPAQPLPPPVPGRATREPAAGGSSLGRFPKLPLQLFLTPARLQRALGSTGRGSCISRAQDKVTSGAVR